MQAYYHVYTQKTSTETILLTACVTSEPVRQLLISLKQFSKNCFDKFPATLPDVTSTLRSSRNIEICLMNQFANQFTERERERESRQSWNRLKVSSFRNVIRMHSYCIQLFVSYHRHNHKINAQRMTRKEREWEREVRWEGGEGGRQMGMGAGVNLRVTDRVIYKICSRTC